MYPIEVQNVTKRFGEIVAVNNVSFNVRKGEIFSLLGPNGAGKTTLVNIITCQLNPDSGTCKVFGMDVTKKQKEIKRLIGFCPQEIVLYDFLSARENLKFFADLYNLPSKEAKTRIEEMLSLVGLSSRADDKIRTYSGGMKRRLNIAAAFLHDPQILILDEPTTGLDPSSRRAIWDLITTFKEEGKTVLMSTHYMDEAESLSNRVAIMDQGKIIALDTPKKLKKMLEEKSAIQLECRKLTKKAVEELSKISTTHKVAVKENLIRIVVKDVDETLPKAIEIALKNGAWIEKAIVLEPTLEDVFIKLTGKTLEGE